VVLIGLTGGIGSGKSTVSSMLAGRGVVVIDADQIARDVVEPGGPAYEAVVNRFGPGVVGADGALDRPALAEIVFSDPDARDDLGRITHPVIAEVMAKRLADQEGSDNLVVLDVPLLVESSRPHPGMLGVVVVDVAPETARARLVESRGMTEEEVDARMAAQATREERLARADFVLDNSGSLSALEAEVDRLQQWVARLERSSGKGPAS
jgi:dephospho-CoA kinase